MVGKTISHYKVLEKLGQGGRGEVSLAGDCRLDRKVALKILPQHLSERTELRARGYDISPDGQRFLMIQSVEEVPPKSTLSSTGLKNSNGLCPPTEMIDTTTTTKGVTAK